LEKYHPPNLSQLAKEGVHAERLVPMFPSMTFPNHQTIVTGLRPAHHGIIHNDMYDPVTKERFSISGSATTNGAWWGGEPIWVTAIRQHRHAMDMFWPGSEAPIKRTRPDRWWPFDGSVPNAERVTRVLDWLALPAAERPSMVTLYFQEVDHIGHVNGPDSREVLEAAAHLDTALGQLVAGITRLGLTDRTDIVVAGAGVVGLAIARALATAGREVVILEKAEAFGTETSSRNSEVIHAGLYTRPDP